MTVRQVLVPVVFLLGALGVGLLATAVPGLYFAMAVCLYVAIAVGFAVRIARARKHRVRDGLAPAGDALEIAQDLYLSRRRYPVRYGDDTPDPDATLYVDTPEHDPADLTDLTEPDARPAAPAV